MNEVEIVKRERVAMWTEIKEFAKEQGFSMIRENDLIKKVYLPLGEFADMIYGINLHLHMAQGLAYPSLFPYILNKKDGKLYEGELLRCTTHQLVVRTAELGDKDYVIEKKRMKENPLDIMPCVDWARSLMLAIKFKDLGTLDYSFLKPAYSRITKLLPEDIARELIDNKLSELEEKIEEAHALSSVLPKLEYAAIVLNIVSDFCAYLPCTDKDIVEKHMANLSRLNKIIKKDYPELADLISTASGAEK